MFLSRLHTFVTKRTVMYIVLFLCFLACLPFAIFFVLTRPLTASIFTEVENVSPTYAALILGAGVNSNGSPSDILRDRIHKGVELYKAGKVKKLIMSGDNRVQNYNEPQVMMGVAIEQGVPAS